jgi:hypothetical protein
VIAGHFNLLSPALRRAIAQPRLFPYQLPQAGEGLPSGLGVNS